MDPFLLGLAGVFLFFILTLMGIYVAVSLGLVGILGTIIIIGFSPSMHLLSTTIFHYGTGYAFIVMPLFVAMGLFSSEAGVSSSIYDACSKWLGWMRGGLGMATVGASTIFGALTGSSIVTAMVFAKISVPEMVKYGYDKKLSYGLTSSSGAIGMMIPPSILAVVYATITEESIGKLFMGCLPAGLILALSLATGFYCLVFFRPSMAPPTAETGLTWKKRIISLGQLWPVVVVILTVMGGIYTGMFTVVEASAFGTFVLFLLFLIIRGISHQSFKTLTKVLVESVTVNATVLLILICAQIFSRFIALTGIGNIASKGLIAMDLSPTMFIIMVAALYSFLGLIIDSVSIIAMTVPLLHPIALALGIHPVYLAVVLILCTQIGNITPPVGMIIFGVKGVAGDDISLVDLFRGVFPFFFMMVVAVAILIAFPGITTWLPDRMVK